MPVIHMRAVFPLVLGAVFACSGRDADKAAADSADSARDVTVVPADTSTQPQLKDVPASPPASSPSRPKSNPPRTNPPASQPAATTPPPAPAPKGPSTGTIASGTALALTSGSKVCTNTNKIGDRFN